MEYLAIVIPTVLTLVGIVIAVVQLRRTPKLKKEPPKPTLIMIEGMKMPEPKNLPGITPNRRSKW